MDEKGNKTVISCLEDIGLIRRQFEVVKSMAVMAFSWQRRTVKEQANLLPDSVKTFRDEVSI
jgi:hypothetical protein